MATCQIRTFHPNNCACVELTRALDLAAKRNLPFRVFHRTINDYAANTDDAPLRKFIDMLGDNIDQESLAFAAEFYERIKTKIDKENISEYTNDWVPRKGIEFDNVCHFSHDRCWFDACPQNIKHTKYLTTICSDVENFIKTAIENVLTPLSMNESVNNSVSQAIQASKQSPYDEHAVRESVLHSKFAAKHTSSFFARDTELQAIQKFIASQRCFCDFTSALLI